MLISALLVPAAMATPEVDLSAQIRPRFEYHTGRDAAEGGEAWMVSQRARLGLSSTLGDVTLNASMQDVRSWGEEANTLKDYSADNFDMHTANLAWQVSENNTLTIGRQEINIHGQRLIGAVGWTQQGRSFDGARYNFNMGNINGDIVSAVLQREGAEGTADSMLGVVRAGWASDGTMADLLYIMDTNSASEMTRHTAGLYSKMNVGPLAVRVEGYGQFGEVGESTINAFLAGARATWAPEMSLSPSVTLWYDMLSGDDDLTDSENTAFNTLFATNHKFYGHIDIAAFKRGAMADGRGLQDIALKLAMTPIDGWKLGLDAHMFSATADSDGIGNELDLSLKTKLAGGLGLAFGASTFMYADSAEELDNWAWLMLNGSL